MKIIFFGSSDFGIPILEELNKIQEVILVVTQPDRRKGRSLRIGPTSIKLCADRLGIKTFQPEDINSPTSLEYLKDFNADLFIVVSFGQFLGKKILGLPRLYPLNIHASLLPKYRGAAPINWAIANGEKESGITIIRMNEKMDEGDILLKESVPIDDEDDAITFSMKLSREGAKLVIRAIQLVCTGSADFVKQDSRFASYAPKLRKEDGIIDWRLSAEEISNRIRGFVPWPGCFTYWDEKVIKIWKARPCTYTNEREDRAMPGTVISFDKNMLFIKTGKGILGIEEVQLEGRRRMKVNEFIIGHRGLTPLTRFGRL